MANVISGHGIPTASRFAVSPYQANGTPLYIDVDSQLAYYLNSSGVVTAINTGTATSATSIIYTPAGSGAVTATVQNKLREEISVCDYGAAGGASNAVNLAGFTAAYNFAQAGQTILIPASSSTYGGVNGILTGSKFVIWKAEGQPTSGVVWSLPGIVDEGYTNRRIFNVEQTTSSDFARFEVRRITSHTGGTPGNVSNALRVTTQVTNSGVANFEWGLTSVLNNYASAGANVAIYAQGNKRATGPTWGMVAESSDYTNTADPTTGLVGIEVDTFANGSDANDERIGIDIAVSKATPAGAKCYAYAGIRVDAAFRDTTKGEYNYGIVLNCSVNAGIQMNQTGAKGIDTTAATFSSHAIHLKEAQQVAFDTGGVRFLYYQTGSFNYKVSGTIQWQVSDTGVMNTAGAHQVQGTQVVGSRKTGYTNAWTGVQNRGTAYDPSTITLVQLAERVSAIQTDLTLHGLIGV